MNDKSSNGGQNDYLNLLLNKLNQLITNLDQVNLHEDEFKKIINELGEICESGIEAGFPELIDIFSLINESVNKVISTQKNEIILNEYLDSILPNLYSYINNPVSSTVKDALIGSLQKLECGDNKQITMLRDMLDVFHCNTTPQENCATQDISRYQHDESLNQLQEYIINKKLPKDTREILEIMMSEYLAIDNSVTEILGLIDKANSELLNIKLDEIRLSYTYYSDAILSMGYEGLSRIINHIIFNITEYIKNDIGEIKRLFVILKKYTSIIMQYLQDPYATDNKIHIIESIKNIYLPLNPELNDIEDIISLINSMDYKNENNNNKNETRISITNEDVSLEIQDDIDQELLDALLNELPEQIEELSNSMQNLFKNYNPEEVLKAKRIAHTLKGSANTVGIRGIASMTHHLEDILLYISKRDSKPYEQEVNIIQNLLDCLCEMSDAVLGTGPAPTDAIAVLQQAIDYIYQLQTGDEEDIKNNNTNQKYSEKRHDKNYRSENKITDQISMVRVSGDFIDFLLRMSGESMIASRRLQNQVINIKNQINETNKYFELLNSLNSRLENIVDIKDLSNSKNISSDKPEYDSLEMDNYSELHICSKHLVEVSSDIEVMSQQIKRQLDELNNIILKQMLINNESQEIIFKARMVPASTISTRLQRCVRQAAKLTNKNVVLTIKGGDTLIDGEILNELLEPLSHIIRNAVDHGVEENAIRINKGKSINGNIELHYEVDGNNINIKCSDDGAGLDFESIHKKAVKDGVIPEDYPDTNEKLTELIFKPGFTTKKETSQISGRGIGLDAVYSAINKLSGTINILSQNNIGTTIVIKLPQNLQKIYGLVVSTGQDSVVLANRDISQILYNENVKIVSEDNKDYIIYNKNKYPARYLESLMYVDAERREKPRFTTSSIIYNTDNEPTAIIVQKIVSSNYFIVKKLSDYIPKITGILGVTILDNGKVTPVIDLVQFINKPLSDNKKAKRSIKSRNTSLPKAVVVDDSLTARKSLMQFMEDSGFQVRPARDGVEALNIIKFYKPDIVITDLEMPEMTGIELTNHIRSIDSLSLLPIIMITSRALEKHKNEAIKSGVNAYFIKPYSETELIETIRDLFKTKNRSIQH